MDEICEECQATISRRAKANIWQGQKVVCTPCLKELKAAETRAEAIHTIVGKAGAPWLVRHGRKQYGPYPTELLIEYVRQGRVDWSWEIQRDGMKVWKKVSNLFTIPELSNGKIELRDFGQGDGTYRP